MTPIEYAQAEELLASRSSERVLAHSRAVAHTASLLADIYCVNVDHARLAGLLHDWDRDLEGEALVEAAQSLGIGVSTIDRAVPGLLHARTAAADLASLIPSLPKEVLQAIERHTVGSPEMSDLDMVVYIADMISPDRAYGGVAELREAVGNVGLRDLFALCYAQSVGHLVRERRHIHPLTVDVWNSLVARGCDE